MSIRPFPKWRAAPTADQPLDATPCRIADCAKRPSYIVRDRAFTDVVCGQHLTPFLAEVLGTMGAIAIVEMLWR